MVERKLFKTKLCVLFKRGRCSRQTCSFAHGEAELRRFSNSFNGRRDYRGSDLRDKIVRRRSAVQRYSPSRDARARRTSQGYSPSSLLGKRRTRQLNAASDFSGSLKISDGNEDQVKDKKAISSSTKDVLDDQLMHVLSEVDVLEDHKSQLEIILEERVQEADIVTSRIQELEMQLSKENEECKRITSKVKKFIKAHKRHSRIQEELKRSQDRLHKLADQLGLDASKPGANEEDTSINILSDGETVANHVISPRTELIASPRNKRQRVHVSEVDERQKQKTPAKIDGLVQETIRLEKLPRWDVHRAKLIDNKEVTVKENRNNGGRPVTSEDKPKRGKNTPNNFTEDKVSEPGLVLPSTSMAAHAVDEVVEMDEKFEDVGNGFARVEKGVTYEVRGLPFPLPPPPPLPQNAYLLYRGDDENGVEDETVDVDII